MMIFPRKNYKEFMLKGAPPGTIGDANPSGWSTEELYFKFMQHFIKNTKPSKNERVLLIIDNHETHLSLQTVDLAANAGVVILTLPPHCSHRLQPLDVSVYFPFKAFYNQGIESWLINDLGQTMDIYCVAEIVGQAYPRVFTTSNIASGFWTSGIYPLNRYVFNDTDFLQSYVTERPAPVDPNPEMTPTGPSHYFEEGVPGPSMSFTDCSSVTPAKSLTVVDSYKSIPVITPGEIQPFPKAGARKNTGKKRGKQPGRTKIATDTPEKNELKK